MASKWEEMDVQEKPPTSRWTRAGLSCWNPASAFPTPPVPLHLRQLARLPGPPATSTATPQTCSSHHGGCTGLGLEKASYQGNRLSRTSHMAPLLEPPGGL